MKRFATTLVLSSAMLASATLFAQGTGQAAGAGAPPQGQIEVPWNDRIPAGTPAHATKALAESTRHGEWVDIALPGGGKLNSFVIYPERKDKAGVVLVIHDINGMRDIPRAVGDQLAQDGFIAIVPDFLSGKGPDGGGSASLGQGVGQAIRALTGEEMTTRLNAAMEYGRKLPASNGKTGVVGFCWGGTQSFNYAIAQPNLGAAVVYYGNPTAGRPSPEVATDEDYTKIKAPVLGLYAGNDARIGATIPATEEAMKKLKKSYEKHIFENATHGFMGSQAGAGGANLKASEQAWPVTIAFFQKHLK
ncbi:MAG TPA: dienelactone hydrolase family protein [Vicinamibacterales bacterium]|nr:dienelactone hydrolase family protein [Vicinamibacterales bacterium]